MRKFLIAAALLTTVSVAPARATMMGPCGGFPCPPPGAGSTLALSVPTGAAVVMGFQGFIGLLVGYDIQRRWTCSGDYLGLGGPGFSTRLSPAASVKPPPVCRH